MAWLSALLAVALVAALAALARRAARERSLKEQLRMARAEAAIAMDEASVARQRLADAIKFLSHDARSPHSSVLSLIELPRLGAPEAGDTRELMGRIRAYAAGGLAEAEDFLQLAHAEAGRFALAEEDLFAILSEAVDLAWARARGRRIRIELADREDPAPCQADHAMMTRALRNLLDNAIVSSPEGTTIQCELREAAEPPGGWQVSIRDQGSGLAVEDIQLMFEKFRKTTGDDRVQGSGLAMAFAKAAVQGHGGTIAAFNCTEQGAEYRVCLPRDGRLPARAAAPAALL